ncbi:MAG: hypothetical protein H6739_06605 [Alphaproteobacteria bacterium]|nr:hypothetical protein [Alphaproteobacteria bacterium]
MREQLLSLWPDDESVRACIKHEAETVDRAVFLAVHQPMQFLREEIGGQRDAGQLRDEQDLLDEFLTRNLPEGRLILPIVGSSGVGKSHVIRWIDAQLKRRADADDRHVIRIPKGTSLKNVLRLLLEGLEGPEYGRLREALSKAREQLDPEKAARLLMLNLRHRLEREAEAAKLRIQAGNAQQDDRLLKDYGDRRALPLLLGDSELEDGHWLTTLDGKKGVMALLAEQVTQRAQSEVDERKHEFEKKDLVFPDELLSTLNEGSRRFYSYLRSTRMDRLADAVRVLNKVLDGAKQDLFQLGDNSLTDLFKDVRAQLHRDGKELVLLVEDLAVLSGMQGALLQVMITEAVRDGVQELCTMRSALAYTEGYANVPETVLTRAGSRWVIQDIPGDSSQILARIERLIGAYLNAARVGRDELQERFSRASDRAAWLPVVDESDMEDDAKEVVRAFGKTEDGYPLFPFNPGAVRQLANAGSTNSKGELVFNPRNVINNVLGKILPERRLFAQGRFPPEKVGGIRPVFQVINEVNQRVRAEHRARTTSLLAVWGDQPTSAGEAAALPEAIYRGFELEMPNWGVAPVVREQHRTASDTLQRSNRRVDIEAPQEAKDPREVKWQQVLEAWSQGTMLAEPWSRELRSAIAEGILDYLPWNPLLLRKPHDGMPPTRQVYLPNARGQTAISVDQACLVLATEDDFADDVRRARVIRDAMAIVRARTLHNGWTYPGAETDSAVYAAFFEARAPQAEAFLRARYFRTEADTVPALVELLLVGARALGVDGAEGRGLTPKLNALLADAEAPPREGTTEWGRLLTDLAGGRSELREALLDQVGARQGTGATVHALDVQAVRGFVEATATDWLPTQHLSSDNSRRSYTAIQSVHTNLRSRLQRVLIAERTELLAWHEKASQWFGEAPDKSELRETMRTTVTRAKAVAPDRFDYDSLRRRISELNDLALVGTLKNCARLQDSDAAGDVLSVLARRPRPVVQATEELMRAFDAFLDQYERGVASRILALGEDPLGGQVQGVAEELDLLQALFQGIEEVRP